MTSVFSFFKKWRKKIFFDSKKYWENRYNLGGTSGPGSYGQLAEFKADVINSFIERNKVSTVIELGCGDGNQLELLEISQYCGFDVSERAIEICRQKFLNDNSKIFKNVNDYNLDIAELVLSLDVIFHLVEEHVFQEYMTRLFNASKNYVIIYSSNKDDLERKGSFHVKHRKFTNWIEKNNNNFRLVEVIENKFPFDGNDLESSFSDFYLYSRIKSL